MLRVLSFWIRRSLTDGHEEAGSVCFTLFFFVKFILGP
jgi:hypothetical protein